MGARQHDLIWVAIFRDTKVSHVKIAEIFF
jgi:hypothetical protein